MNVTKARTGVLEEASDEELMNTTDIKSFHYLEDGSIDFSILSTKYTRSKLDKGVYSVGTKNVGGTIQIDLKQITNYENYNTELDYYYTNRIDTIYKSFFNQSMIKKIHKLGYKHKLGILLYGKQGTGKTTMFKKYFERTVNEHDGLIFIIEEFGVINFIWNFIMKIRKIQKNPIICFMDEFDTGFEMYGDFEQEMKTIMDGIKSIDNCMFFTATNYIDKIPKTIKERKSRIKYSIQATGINDLDVIEKFLKINLESIDMDYDLTKKDLEELKGSTVDDLKQLILDKIMKIPLDDDSKYNKKIGFN
jgi:SpoVK/Ycf46/Vps4 family AAA+-type ATPase